MPFSLQRLWLDRKWETKAYPQCEEWFRPLFKLLKDNNYDIRILFNLEQSIRAHCLPNLQTNKLSQHQASFEMWITSISMLIGDSDFARSFIVDAMIQARILCPGYPWSIPFNSPKRKISIKPVIVTSFYDYMKENNEDVLKVLTQPFETRLLDRTGLKYNTELGIDYMVMPYDGDGKIKKHEKYHMTWVYDDKHFIEIVNTSNITKNKKSLSIKGFDAVQLDMAVPDADMEVLDED